MKPRRESGAEIGGAAHPRDPEGTRKLEPNLNPVFRHSLFWPDVASLSNPLMVTRAYAARLAALGGVVIKGDARSLHRVDGKWRGGNRAGAGRFPEAGGGARAPAPRRAGAPRPQGAR